MTRLLDFVLSFFGLVLFSPLLVVLLFLGWFDTRSPLFRQERVGKAQKIFVLVKFRTMRPGSASVGTHLADASLITSFGRFLRRTKLDELPQLWNVLKGDMSLVGPRPCLPNQIEVIAERVKLCVYSVRPGITGLAQLNNVDMSTPLELADMDSKMISDSNVLLYFRCIALTLLGGGSGDRVKL